MLTAIILVAVGLLLIVPSWQTRFALLAGPISSWADNRLGHFATTGLQGQLALGLLLGVIWSPCVGPTLGAASVLASRGQSLSQVALVMAAFGAGAALPLLVLGLLPWRGGGAVSLASVRLVKSRSAAFSSSWVASL